MAAQITAAQVKQQLSALGYSIPDFMIDAYLCKLDGIRQCLEASGYDDCDLMLIQVYAVTLMAITAFSQRIKSQSAPSGASRSFDYSGDIKTMRNTLAALDTAGCTASLPIDVGTSVGFFDAVGGC
ncbi:DUF7370 family protein [Serratia marcescens]|uniref:DUF7370 family protein n=1 Tax=Serratia marcescens TaxID=615 RepID=UPI000744F669|nr:hypothetical protein [Serratia marcescens]CUY56681.1 Uncharacterised protein [Serratia marcescens]